jgi:hypothetical protein
MEQVHGSSKRAGGAWMREAIERHAASVFCLVPDTRFEQTSHNPADPRDPSVEQQEESPRSADQGAAAPEVG